MIRRVARLGAISAAFLLTVLRAAAQPTPPPDGVAVGEFWFRPRLELRARGEYYHNPVETSGTDASVLGSRLAIPIGMADQWVAHERARLGLEVERGILSAAVVVQGAHIAGYPSPLHVESHGEVPSVKFQAAYLETRSTELRPSFVRLGRQEIAWGEGRLLGTSAWQLVPRSLDAVRARWVVRQFDFEAMAAILTPPGVVPPQYAQQGSAVTGEGGRTGSGVQLYGVNTALHLEPLLHFEVASLARIARMPLPTTLAPSDTYVIDARVFGERAGWSYAAEFAYEVGRMASVDRRTSIAAWAATAHADWQTTWFWRPKLSVSGSYATGDDGSKAGTIRAFDPILPDARAGVGQMGIYSWSNILDAAFTLVTAPTDDLRIHVGYHYLRLADPGGAWFSASLLPVGQNPQNDAAFLGHEIDASVSVAPIDSLTVRGGYGALITGEGARAILSGRKDGGPTLLSAAFLQVELLAP